MIFRLGVVNTEVLTSCKKGETVIDLGSGGGLDVFLAAAKVGPTGRAIGVDMNKVRRHPCVQRRHC